MGLSVSFGSVSESDDTKEHFSMLANPDLSSKHMEEISIFKAIDFEPDICDEIYFQALFWRTSHSSPKPDAVIDAQFEAVLAANEILSNYDDLVTDYDQLMSDSSIQQGIVQHLTGPCLAYGLAGGADTFGQSIFFEDPAAPVVTSQSLLRKMSNPPLSPIPEETTEFLDGSDVEDPVFVAPSLSSTPAGKLPRVDHSHSTPESDNSDYFIPSRMDSGYYESFSSG